MILRRAILRGIKLRCSAPVLMVRDNANEFQVYARARGEVRVQTVENTKPIMKQGDDGCVGSWKCTIAEGELSGMLQASPLSISVLIPRAAG